MLFHYILNLLILELQVCSLHNAAFIKNLYQTLVFLSVIQIELASFTSVSALRIPLRWGRYEDYGGELDHW